MIIPRHRSPKLRISLHTFNRDIFELVHKRPCRIDLCLVIPISLFRNSIVELSPIPASVDRRLDAFEVSCLELLRDCFYFCSGDGRAGCAH